MHFDGNGGGGRGSTVVGFEQIETNFSVPVWIFPPLKKKLLRRDGRSWIRKTMLLNFFL